VKPTKPRLNGERGEKKSQVYRRPKNWRDEHKLMGQKGQGKKQIRENKKLTQEGKGV